MAKGTSLFSTLSGKVGNVVAARIPNAADKRSQGVRAYQPVISNPKSYAQAEQRCKYVPLMKLYNVLRHIILRGQEGVPYGAPSRYAWLSQAMKNYEDGWFERGDVISVPPLVPVSKGTIPFSYTLSISAPYIVLPISYNPYGSNVSVGQISTLILKYYTCLNVGDQLTFITFRRQNNSISTEINSLVLDPNCSDAHPNWCHVSGSSFYYHGGMTPPSAAVIIASRLGSNKTHLRSTGIITSIYDYPDKYLGGSAKDTAIRSYMSDSSNTDWAEQTLT